MREVKHTPGPWEVTSIGCGKYKINIPGKEINKHFAIIEFTNLADMEHDKANARLIAVAPELLEACRLLVKSFGLHGPCENNECENCNYAYEQGVTAIAKAKG